MADIKDVGALAGIIRYGVPWHGRIQGGTLYTGLFNESAVEVTRTWANPGNGDCWLIQKPGQPDPYAIEGGAAIKAEDALFGKELTNYALLNGTGMVHGQSIVQDGYVGAWLHIDADGVPWSVSYKFLTTNFAHTASHTIQFKALRFGDLQVDGEPAVASEWSLTIAAGALQQSTPALTSAENTLTLRRVAVDATGARVIFAVYASAISSNEVSYINRPLGFCQITVANGLAGFSAEFALLASRATALGTMTYNGYQSVEFTASDCLSYPGSPNDIWAAGTFNSISTTYIGKTYANRIIGYSFDADDDAVPFFLNGQSITQTDDDFIESRDTGFPDRTPTWSYTRSVTTERTLSYAIASGALSLTVAAIHNRDEGYIGSGYNNWSSVAYTDSNDYSATGMPSISYTSNATASVSPIDIETGCTLMPGSGTTTYPQPSDATKASELYLLPNALTISIYTASCMSYSASLKSIRLTQSSMTSLNPAWIAKNNICGAIAPDALNASVYPSASATYASYNPATGVIAYPKTAQVSFT